MPEAPAKSSAVVVPNAPSWQQRLAGWIIFALIKVVSATLRVKWTDRAGFFAGQKPGPAIYCVWHNRLALSMKTYYSYIKKRNESGGLVVLVSASKDGGFLTSILEWFGVKPVRGSTSRRGPQALLELTTWSERGYDLAITPDGPRGPCYQVQEGIIALARVTEKPIVPVSFNLSWKIRVKSWDRFQIPLPFSRCEIIFEKPVRVPRDASDSEREACRAELEQKLRSMTRD